ncbi:MIP/aquaporin family protein [Fodinicola acaciae]|uniref:MIP/aquaporin family protein n=1 Tax=Fodinicola acaciae TaxID=2681555 RepID=UPI0013D859D0|nr:MIP/aquaporin family protein [Fodinicola acaciae]
MTGRKLLAEFLGTALLVAVVVGSGIAASRLSPSDVGLQLLENAAATAAGLVVLILIFGPVSGAHFNPVVSIVDAVMGGMRWREVTAYALAQTAGAVFGAILANTMFGAVPVSISTKPRSSLALWLSEIVATAGLVLLIFALTRTGRGHLAAPAVGAYIGSAYFFTASTSFANPAVAIGRVFSDSFAGISPWSVPGFVIAELAGAGVAVVLIRVLFASERTQAVAASERGAG